MDCTRQYLGYFSPYPESIEKGARNFQVVPLRNRSIKSHRGRSLSRFVYWVRRISRGVNRQGVARMIMPGHSHVNGIEDLGVG